MKRSRLWTGVLSALVALGCAFNSKDAKGDPVDKQPVYVDDVSAPASAPSGAAVNVLVNGNLPTPAWEITDVDIQKDDRHVRITIWGVLKDERPGIQVLQPFTRTVPVTGLEPGTWTIEVIGHGGTGDKVQVQVQ
jgi:hypothetical protein